MPRLVVPTGFPGAGRTTTRALPARDCVYRKGRILVTLNAEAVVGRGAALRLPDHG
ncbi:hypothetical protein SAMN04489832_2616 [Micromonospora cremea]|uniref:Uncharacterized protein n=1 Tax=Micromonospora cremea TaxID=709881 RepID=A0A1N5WNI7_9ACTN|nr:hypothetical protein SAMN04489832_2616 [Micromonospora cremea]